MSASELFVYSELATPRVRVGIVAEESRLPAYAGSVVRDLLRANFVEPTCWFEVPRVADAPTRSSIGTLLFRLQELLVEPKYATEPDPLALVDSQSLSSQFKHTIQLAPPGNSNVVDRGDVGSLILEYKLDVIVDFTNRGVERSFADMSSFGLWRFHFGDSRKYPFGSGYWREIVDNEALSGTELRSVGRTHEADRVLSRALFSTTPFPSRLANRLAPIWGATHFVLKNLRELQHSRRNNLRLESRSGGLGPLVRPQPRMPANKDMARWLVREVRRRSIRQFRRQATSRSSWRIALRKSAVPLFLDDHPATLDT
ncbi:MAG TPA: hypothetical protein P5307_04920, partial [Pirellulaceae bacterium]|nr:hypothetical protein [Pirellulaceae bacterium]